MNKPILILLPGLSFDDRVFKAWKKLCEPHFSVQAINYEEIAGLDLKVWFDTFSESMPVRAHYIGWSLGGLFAWKLAQCHPSKVLSIASFASSPKFLAEPAWPGVSAADWAPFIQQDPSKMQRRLLRLQADGSLRELQLAYPNKSWALGLEALKKWDMRSWLQETKTPLLMALAEQDILLPSQLLQDKLGGKAVTLAGCGHACVYTHPKKCFSMWKEFWHAL